MLLPTPSGLVMPAKDGNILHLDIECRPLSWYAGDFVSKEVTAIAAKFRHKKRVYIWMLGQHEPAEMAEEFLKLYNAADIVTGHHIRGFDLPILNSFLLELGKSPLPSKLVSDTKNDLIKFHGFSKSQESLGDLLGIKRPKVSMSQMEWREANRLTKRGLRAVRERVIGDVLQHEELREKLIELNALGRPRMWYNTGLVEQYEP